MLEPQSIRFLKALKNNNNKPWFDSHRAQYEAARIDLQNFVQLVIADLQRSDTTIAGIQARDCMFRINRDIRFSKDKTPYKINMGASIKRGGRKSQFAGYYFHLEPGASFVGGGLWMPEAAALKGVRQEIDYNWAEFKNIISNKTFTKTFGDVYRGDEVLLKTLPKGYNSDNEAIEYLRLKSFIAEVKIKDEDLCTAGLHRKTVDAFEALTPLLHFINRAVEDK